MVDERVLRDAKNPDGSRRFYPAGLHPATARHREIRKRLEQIRLKRPDDPQLLEALGYHDRKIAEFDANEAEVKRRYLDAVSRKEN